MASTTDPLTTATTDENNENNENDEISSRIPCFVVLHNVSKSHNVGTLARSCVAFGVKSLCLVGNAHFNLFGNHGSASHLRIEQFQKLKSCVETLKEVHHCKIIGVEICESAVPVQSHPFCGPTAFLLGNEGSGLSPQQMELCDSFVYIPQYGRGTASLNVTVAASIILHHFSSWANYSETSRKGFKFETDSAPKKNAPRGCPQRTGEEMREIAREREKRRGGGEEEGEEEEGGGGLGGIYGEEEE